MPYYFFSQLAFREMDDDMMLVGNAIITFLQSNDKLAKKLAETLPKEIFEAANALNSLVVGSYFMGKHLNLHCDQRFDHEDGSFLHSQNCQKMDTPTFVISVGDPRIITMQLMRRKTDSDGPAKKSPIKIKTDKATKQFTLEHGTLFVLHPDDGSG